MKLNNVPKKPLRRLVSGLGFVLASGLSQQAIPQNLGNPWVPIHVDANNSTLFFHAETTKFFSFPPSLVSFNLLEVSGGKASSNYNRFEASCNTAEIKVNESAFIAVGSENTARHLILRALCGFAMDDGYWIGLLSESQGPRKNMIYFVNVMSITRVVDPFPGYSAQGTVGVWKHGQRPLFELSEARSQWFYTCNSPYRFSGKESSNSGFKPEETVGPDTPLGGVLSILCSGQFPVIQTAVNNPPDVKKDEEFDSTSLEDAKTKCKDLGFKPASEKFGDCVLRLSR